MRAPGFSGVALLTLVLAIFQSYGIAIGLQALEEPRPEMASFTPAQVESLKYLLETIIARYRIPADQVFSVREFRDLNAGIETADLRELLAVR